MSNSEAKHHFSTAHPLFYLIYHWNKRYDSLDLDNKTWIMRLVVYMECCHMVFLVGVLRLITYERVGLIFRVVFGGGVSFREHLIRCDNPRGYSGVNQTFVSRETWSVKMLPTKIWWMYLYCLWQVWPARKGLLNETLLQGTKTVKWLIQLSQNY